MFRIDDIQDSISTGFNYRLVESFKNDDGSPQRDLFKLYGIRFTFENNGQGGKFNFASLTVTLGAGLALLVRKCHFLLHPFERVLCNDSWREPRKRIQTNVDSKSFSSFMAFASCLRTTAKLENQTLWHPSRVDGVICRCTVLRERLFVQRFLGGPSKTSMDLRMASFAYMAFATVSIREARARWKIQL